MKHTKSLIILILCLNSLSNCAETPQSSPTATTSWWDRSKNYATSWVPQSMKYQAKTLSRSINDNLNPMRSYYLNKQASLIAQDIWQLIEDKIKDQNFDISPEINNIMKSISQTALERDFDAEKIINNGLNLAYRKIILRKKNLNDIVSSKYKLCRTTSCKDFNEKLIQWQKKTSAELLAQFKIFLEIEKIIRATDLTKIKSSPIARL